MRRREDGTKPSWARLCKLAAPQLGYFTKDQAETAGYSRQLVQYYIQKSLIEWTEMGVFHLTHFPRGDREDLIVLWLWSRCQGVFSHETALLMHGLVDEPAPGISMTLPETWRRRRQVRRPLGLKVYYDDMAPELLVYQEPLTLTNPLRTLSDCVIAGVDQELVKLATRHAIRRQLFTRGALQKAVRQRHEALLAAAGPVRRQRETRPG